MSRATTLYRICAFVLLLFAAGHTFGFLTFEASTADGRAVFQSMTAVHFQVRGSSFSYGGFYTGFGLSITAYLLFFAFLSWQLGTLANTHPEVVGFLGWAFCGVQVASVALSWTYFSAAPAVFSGVLSLLLGWAAWLTERSIV